MSFGDRKDGYRVRDIHGSNKILIDFKPNRCDAAVYMNETLDVTEFVKKMNELKSVNNNLTYFHGLCFLIAKLIYSRPYLNRFVADRKMYMHKEVSLAFTAKAEFEDESIEYLSLIKFDDNDTINDVSAKVKKKVDIVRSNRHSGGANGAVDIVGKLPTGIRACVVGILKWMDKKGILPNAIIEDNLYYSSMILSNLGTFKTSGIYHNLTNFGTSSSLVTIGEIKKCEDGRYRMNIGATLDERIADGFYMCKALKLFEQMLTRPELLDEAVSVKVKYNKEA